MLSFFKGDTIILNVTVGEDITDWKIRAEFYSGDKCGCSSTDSTHLIKLATANSGGSTDEISITNATAGKFTIHVEKNLTTHFHEHSMLEIEVEDSDGQIFTIEHINVEFKKQKITWSSPD